MSCDAITRQPAYLAGYGHAVAAAAQVCADLLAKNCRDNFCRPSAPCHRCEALTIAHASICDLASTPAGIQKSQGLAWLERAAAATCRDCECKSPVREVEGHWLHDMTIPGEPAPSYTRRCRAEAIHNMIKLEVKS